MSNNTIKDLTGPLEFDEVIGFLKDKWGVSYEIRILIRDKNAFLQIMWGFLEQKSFPENEMDYRNSLSKVLEVINRSGQAPLVRHWFMTVKDRPKVGKALSLRLERSDRLDEFVI